MPENQALVRVIADHQAMLNVTYAGQNGEMRDPVPYNSTDAEIKAWATEAVRNGDIGAIGAKPNVDFGDYVIDRFGPVEERPYNLLMLRSKTPFGG